VIFLGQGARRQYLQDLSKSDVPFVVWGAVQEVNSYCAVGTDNVRGGMLAGQRLAALRRRNVVFLSAEGHIEFELRRQGFERGLKESSAAATITDLNAPDLTYEHALSTMGAFLASGRSAPDGVFAASDTMAMAACAALKEAGLSVPSSVSVIGYDDIPFASLITPPLTTIRQNTGQGGAILVEKLMQRLEGRQPSSVLLPTELIVRAS
jgi:DNA-binding LacI/PurR family transcriptional regulator